MRFQSLFLALASICTITRALPLDTGAVAVNRDVGAGDILLTREVDVDVRAPAADRNAAWKRTAVAAATWRRVAREAGTVSWKRTAEAEAGLLNPKPWRRAAEADAEPRAVSWKRSAEADAEPGIKKWKRIAEADVVAIPRE